MFSSFPVGLLETIHSLLGDGFSTFPSVLIFLLYSLMRTPFEIVLFLIRDIFFLGKTENFLFFFFLEGKSGWMNIGGGGGGKQNKSLTV